MDDHFATRREALRTSAQLALLVIAAIAIEVFVFNFRFFESRSWSPVEPTRVTELAAGDRAADGSLLERPALEFEFADGAELNSLALSGPAEGPESILIYVRDEGNALYYLAGAQGYDGADTYVRLHPGGEVSSVRLEVDGAAPDADLPDVSVAFNVAAPFSFGLFRCALVLGLLLVVYLAGFCGPLLRAPLKRRHVVIVAVLGVAVVCALTYRFRTPLALQPYYEHQYFELSQALAQGRVALDAVPSEGLAALSNPYDTGLRAAGGIDALWDHAYFEGSYYVYFGILPALLFHLPWYLLTGGELPNWVVVMAMSAAFAAGVAFCLEAIFLHERKRPSLAAFLGLYAAVMFCSYIVNACGGPDMYSSPIVTALACAAWGVTFWLRATTPREACHAHGEGVRLGWGVAGSLLMALIALARPQLLLLCLLGIPLIVPALRREPTPARAAGRLAVVLVPFVVAFAAAGAYNYARFGSPLDFGANYNLTNNDMTVRGWNVDRTVEGLLSYLLQFPRLTLSPLSIESATPLIQYFGVSITGVLPGGILLVAPVLLTIPLWLARPGSGGGARGMSVLLALVAVCVAAFDANGAGVLTRYYLDFGFAFALSLAFAVAHAWDGGLYLAKGAALVPAQRALRTTDRLVWLSALAVTCLMSIIWLCVKTGL